jgi:hypothetical protein
MNSNKGVLTMKSFRNNFFLLLPCLVMSMFLVTSCDDEDGVSLESPDGAPSIKYIRVSDPEASDSLLVGAELGATIVIVGENLGGTRAILFNDQKADLLPTWVTNRTIFATVPFLAPTEVTNKLYLVTESGDTIEHAFTVEIPAPAVSAAKNEWPQADEDLVIYGDYFFEPLTVEFTGAGAGEIVSVSQTQIVVDVPDGATEGPVTVTTNFGETPSTFHLWDKRNIVLDFDEKRANGWRIGMRGNDPAHSLDGYYLIVKGNINANQRDEGPGGPAESPFAMEYWGGNDPDRSENFYPLYPNSYRDYVMKFEAKIKKWYGGHLNLCLSVPDHTGNNQEIWSNNLNARGIWAPWTENDEEVTTGDSWITVVMPLTEFQYYMGSDANGVYYTPGQKFVESAAGSLSTWFLGSPENTGNEVEFYLDNIRFVEP